MHPLKEPNNISMNLNIYTTEYDTLEKHFFINCHVTEITELYNFNLASAVFIKLFQHSTDNTSLL